MSYLSLLQQMATQPTAFEAGLSRATQGIADYGSYVAQERERLRQEQKQEQEQERQMAMQEAQMLQKMGASALEYGQPQEAARLLPQYQSRLQTAFPGINIPKKAIMGTPTGRAAPLVGPPVTSQMQQQMNLPADLALTSPVVRPEPPRDFSQPQTISALRAGLMMPKPEQSDLVLSYKPDGTATYVRKELGATIRPEPRIPTTKMFQDYDPVTGRVTLVPGAPGTVLTPRPSMQLSYSPEGTQATVVPMVPGAQVGVRRPASEAFDKRSQVSNKAVNNIESIFPGALTIDATAEGEDPAFVVSVDTSLQPIASVQKEFKSRGFQVKQLQGGGFLAVAGKTVRAGLPAPRPTPPRSELTALRIEDLQNKIFKDYVAQRDINLWNRIQGKQFAMIQPDDQMKLDVIKVEFNKRPGVKPAAASSGPSTRPSTRPSARPSAPPSILPQPQGGPGVDIDSIRDVLRSKGEQ
jgi:hypothetical protein